MRAIILAAGMGTRLHPITLTTPKSLINVNGETLIERQIKFLKNKGIDDILVVTGYLADQFAFLAEKYQVTLVHNKKYAEYNNFYTMYLVRKYLEDSYVIDADNYLFENFFDPQIKQSTYFGVKRSDCPDEWFLKVDKNNRVQEIVVGGTNGLILSGVSFWNKETAKKINALIESTFKQENYQNLYWDDIVKNNISILDIAVREIASKAIYEIDSIEDYKQLLCLLKEGKKRD